MSINEKEISSKHELIKKLETISDLRDKALLIKNKMINFIPVDAYERVIKVPVFPGEYEDNEECEVLEGAVEHEDEDALEQMAEVYDRLYCPKEPCKPDIGSRPAHDTPLTNEYKKKRAPIVFVVGFIAICSLISGGLFSGDFLTIIINIVILAVCGFVILSFYKKINELKIADEEVTKLSIEGYECNKKEKEQKYEKDIREYKTLMNSYKLLKADFLEEYAKWRGLYLKSVEEEAEIEEKLEADRVAMVKKIEDEEFIPALNELAEFNNLITNEYLPAIDVIIDLLKSGRADNLKEAINLYEDIVYRERQLQLQREQEEQRRYEEELRRQDEERRYQEEKQFREHQEWERKQEAKERARAEEQRHREEMAQRERQERDRRYEEDKKRQEQRRRDERAELERKYKEDTATNRQCNTCKLCGNCSMAFRRPNCASYKPR